MVVEEEGGAVEADRRLARAGPALHDEEEVERGPDDEVLLGLDGGHDVAHLAGAAAVQLGQERVGDARGAVGAVGVGEVLVEQLDQLTPLQGEAAATGEAEGVGEGGPVEGRGHAGPPVDDHGVAAGVLHVAAADVPPVAGVFIDAAEAQGAADVEGGPVAPHRVLDSGVVEVGTGGQLEAIGEAGRRGLHVGQVVVGAVEVLLFGGEIGMHGVLPERPVDGSGGHRRSLAISGVPWSRMVMHGCV